MSRLVKSYLAFYLVMLAVVLIWGAPILFPTLAYTFTEEEVRYLAALGELRVLADRDFPPFTYVREGKAVGYELDLMRELERVLLIPVKVEQDMWLNVRERLMLGEAHLVSGMRITPERRRLYQFTDPYLYTLHAVITRREARADDLEALRGLPVAAQAGSATAERLVGEGHTIIPKATPAEAFAALARGEVAGWVEQLWVARYIIGAKDLPFYTLTPLPDTQGEYAMALWGQADPRLRRILNKALYRLHRHGVMAEINARWFGPAVTRVAHDEDRLRQALFLFLGVGTLGVGLVFSNAYLQRRVETQTRALRLSNAALARQHERVQDMLINTARAFGVAIEVKDIYTGGHSHRVAGVAYFIAKQLGLTERQMFELCLGSLMHDIGKVGVPEAILTKNGNLTPAEYEYVKQHPRIGHEILRAVDGYEAVRDIVLYHHERWDGQTTGQYPGYPGLRRGTAIPLGARIVAVADAFDAMTSERPYRTARSVSEAVAVIQREAGGQFDPDIAVTLIGAEAELAATEPHSLPMILKELAMRLRV
ncbi:MAG: transporter substrate-binding domain-containing protein [Selenomonadales bacterium]|nr:transporter substrate-binding domain-containing protein [Selenomonadales bacterium]